MVGAGADLAFTPRAHHIARTVLIRAQERASSHHSFGLTGLAGIKRGNRPSGVVCHAASCRKLSVIIGTIPVTHPLPYVSSHVVEAIAVWWIDSHRRDSNVAVFARVQYWKASLKSVRHPQTARPKLVAPNKRLSGKAAASRELPFCFRGQSLPGPLGIRFGVFVSHVHHRVVFSAVEIASWPCRMSPTRSRHVQPPLVVIVEGDRMIRRREDYCARNEIFRRCPGKVLGLWLAFRHRVVFRGEHESRKFLIGHIGLFHPKRVDIDAVNGPGIASCLHSYFIHSRWILSAHREFTTWNPSHTFRRLGSGGSGVGTSRKK